MSTPEAAARLAQVFGSFLRDVSFAFVVSDPRAPDCPICFASEGFLSLTGYSANEVLGRNCRFLQGPDTSRAAITEVRDAVREERSCSVVLLNYKKDGTPFQNAFHLAPVRGASGCVEYFIGLQADVTEAAEAGDGRVAAGVAAQELHEAEGIAQRLLSHQQEAQAAASDCGRCAVDASVSSSMLSVITKVQDVFVLADPNQPDSPIVYASPAFLRLTGYACNEVLGQNCRFLQGPDTDQQQLQILRAALSASPPRPATVTLLNYRRNGEAFWNCLHVAPVRDAAGKVQFFIGVQMDVPTKADAGAAVPEPTPTQLLQQKGVVGAIRVATRALASSGLRRAPDCQNAV